MTALESTPHALYDSLARFEQLRRLWRGRAAGEGLELHKRLRAPAPGVDGPGAGKEALHAWLWAKLAPARGARVLDLGCGFGATTLAFALQGDGCCVGITPSALQVRTARHHAARLRLGERCTFRRQTYDDPIAGRFDLALSIEALLHAPVLTRTLRAVARCLEPGGTLAVVEDMATDAGAAGGAAARQLCERWLLPRIPTAAEWEAALAANGFLLRRVSDLTAQVAARPLPELARAERRLTALRALAPLRGWQRVLDAFLGGIALERLYRQGAMRYRALLAVRAEGP